MQTQDDKNDGSDQSTNKFIKFLGGKTTPYILTSLLLIGLIILIYGQISYIFKPIIIIINTLIAPIIISLVLFYIINPIVNFMQKNRINRVFAIIIIYAFIGFAQMYLINALIPIVLEQSKTFIHDLPNYFETFKQSINTLNQYSLMNDLTYQIQQQINALISHYPDIITDYFNTHNHGIKNLIETTMNISVVFMTTPFVLFFMLKDGPRFRYFIIKILPFKSRKDALSLIYQFNEKVGSYIQGQIIVAICIGILLFMGYSIIGLKYALILALIAAVTSVVPYLGPMIAISPAIIIALMTSPIMLIKLGIVWVVVQFIEGHFISPNIMGKTLKIHPLTIIFVLLCAGKIGGVVGVILGIPSYAVLKVLFNFIFDKIKNRYNQIYGINEGYDDNNDDNEYEVVDVMKITNKSIIKKDILTQPYFYKKM